MSVDALKCMFGMVKHVSETVIATKELLLIRQMLISVLVFSLPITNTTLSQRAAKQVMIQTLPQSTRKAPSSLPGTHVHQATKVWLQTSA